MPLTIKEKAELNVKFDGICGDILSGDPDGSMRDEMELRLEVLMPQLKELTAAFYPLYQDRGEQERPELKKAYEDTKALYFKLVDEVKQSIRQMAVNEEENPPPPHQSVRCSKIKLPEFDGSTEAWVNFRDLFESMVHTNAHMSNIEKFQYLLMSVKLPQSHSNVLSSYSITAENYPDAWKALCDRYNDVQKLVSTQS
jgi:Protein of unknown function (DUF1759)